MQVKKQQLEPDMNNGLVPNWERNTSRLHIVTTYLTNMLSISCKMLGWMKHKLESTLVGEMSITSDVQKIPPLCQKAKKTEEPLDENEKRRVKKLT